MTDDRQAEWDEYEAWNEWDDTVTDLEGADLSWVAWQKRAEIAKVERDKLLAERDELRRALQEIDEMLDGGLPITHQVKSLARQALGMERE